MFEYKSFQYRSSAFATVLREYHTPPLEPPPDCTFALNTSFNPKQMWKVHRRKCESPAIEATSVRMLKDPEPKGNFVCQRHSLRCDVLTSLFACAECHHLWDCEWGGDTLCDSWSVTLCGFYLFLPFSLCQCLPAFLFASWLPSVFVVDGSHWCLCLLMSQRHVAWYLRRCFLTACITHRRAAAPCCSSTPHHEQ